MPSAPNVGRNMTLAAVYEFTASQKQLRNSLRYKKLLGLYNKQYNINRT